MSRITTLLSCLVLSLFTSSDAVARIISYAPVTARFAQPAVQNRDASKYLLLESKNVFTGGIILSPIPVYAPPTGQLVLHDPTGAEEPVVVLSRDGQYDAVEMVAMNETPDGVRHILVLTNVESTTAPPSSYPVPTRYLYSSDDGASWKVLDLPPGLYTPDFPREDVGGRVARGRGSQVRLGTSDTPFVFAAWPRQSTSVPSTTIYAVDKGGSVRQLAELAPNQQRRGMLFGSDREGARFLIAGSVALGGGVESPGLHILHLDGEVEGIPGEFRDSQIEGWITPSGRVYLDQSGLSILDQKISFVEPSGLQPLLTAGVRQWNAGPVIFAVPTHDYSGAWMIERNTGLPTRLLRHTPGVGVETMWSDISGPEVEAVHAAASGERLLIQVHRPRPQDGRMIIDPALAIWEIGSPMPRQYDELFLAEGPTKGFVSLDVDEVAAGGAFIFDSAPVMTGGGGVIISPAPPGGNDVTQEWGVVRASLQQKLVLPALARLPGAYDSFWKSDVTVWNPDTSAMTVKLRFAPSDGTPHLERDLELAAGELSYVPDALATWFGVETGGGALFIDSPIGRAIGVTSRLYTETPEGSFGMGVTPVDQFNASSSRYYLTFAGALQGGSTRTNLLVTDAGGHGASFGVKASGPTGFTGRTDLAIEVPAGGQVQINDLATILGVPSQAAARFETLRGLAIPSLVSIDNRTNDPTLFPPDIVSGIPRLIPMIGHLDGANDSRFRTDVFLYNPSDEVQTVVMGARPFRPAAGVPTSEKFVSFTLLPFESKVIPDIYQTVFNGDGLGRMTFQSGSLTDSDGIRVMARIYTQEPGGGTYGFVMPALNAFQIAGPGESLEIMGAFIDSRFRTNLALVDAFTRATTQPPKVTIEIFATGGALLERFDATMPALGGSHLLDIFNARGLTSAVPQPVIIRITPSVGTVGAFASMVDNGTNDALYLAAGLAAQ